MILYHFTHLRNLPSILSEGLCVRYSTGETRRVWGCETQRREWAEQHVRSRHGWTDDDEVICIRLAVPDNWIHAHGPTARVWWSDRDIPPAHIMDVDFRRD